MIIKLKVETVIVLHLKWITYDDIFWTKSNLNNMSNLLIDIVYFFFQGTTTV